MSFLVLIDKFKEEYLIFLQKTLTKEDLSNAYNFFLGKEGKIYVLNDLFKKLNEVEKKELGLEFQVFKLFLKKKFEDKKREILVLEMGFPEYNLFDSSLEKKYFINENTGSLHPYSLALKKVQNIFISMGFDIIDGPILENEFFNFTALNIKENHPSRDAHDTFWLNKEDLLLRTHTSTTQIREGRKKTPPFGFISPGVVYRNEATDASHDFMFWQFEGLYVNKDASIANLLFVLKYFLQEYFNTKELKIRTRPSYFPFVEPGMEVDMSCLFCKNGCSTCKFTKWIEIGGCGMTHYKVLEQMNISSSEFKAFAFGFGLTRLVMLEYNISDIRLLHSGIFHYEN